MKKTATRMTFLFLALTVPALAASPAMADDKFVQMDADKNGAVSWEEFHATYPQMQRAAFDSIDANKDAAISHEEWDAFLTEHNMGRVGAPGGPVGGAMPPPSKGIMPPAGKGSMPPAGMGTMPPKAMPDAPKGDVPPAMITPPAK